MSPIHPVGLINHERAACLNFRLWIGVPDADIFIHSCTDTSSAERNPLTNRARKSFGIGPITSPSTCGKGSRAITSGQEVDAADRRLSVLLRGTAHDPGFRSHAAVAQRVQLCGRLDGM